MFQAEISLGVRRRRVQRVAEDGYRLDSRTADFRVDVRVTLDNPEETREGMNSNQLLVIPGEALQREHRCASVTEKGRGGETIANSGDGVGGCLLYPRWPAKSGVSLLEELHRSPRRLRTNGLCRDTCGSQRSVQDRECLYVISTSAVRASQASIQTSI